MLEDSAGTRRAVSSRLLVWWANHSHRYVIPIVGAVSISLGLTLAVAPHLPWRTYTPPLLVIVGAGTLASGIATLAIRTSHATRGPSVSRAGPSPVSPPPLPNATLPSSAHRPHGGERNPAPGPAYRGAASDRSLTIPADPGEYLWQSWAAPSNHLPVELVGPVRESAYLPSVGGAPALYEEGEPVFVGCEGRDVQREMTPFPPGESSLLAGEPLATTEIVAPGTSAAGSLPGWTNSASSGGAPSLSESVMTNPVRHEAVNPTPPHLRPRTSSTRPSAPSHRPPPRPMVRGVRCATCHAAVSDPPNWRRCLDCQRHLCAECVVGALLTYQRGWCSRCAEHRNPEPASIGPLPRIPSPRADGSVPPPRALARADLVA